MTETPLQKAEREMWEARERMYQRLAKGERRTRVMWWLLAAAVLISVLGSFL